MTAPVIRGLFAIATVLLLAFAPITAASAQTVANKGTVTLVNQTDWNTGTNPFDLQVQVATNLDPDQTELVVTVFNQVRNRSQFQQSEQNKISGNSIILERDTLSSVMQANGVAEVSLPIQDSTQKRYFLRDPGIYPVRVELRTSDTDTVLSRFVTHLIYEPAVQAPAQPLGVTTVLPVQAAQSINQKLPLATPDSGTPFTTVGKTLAAHPSTPATLIVEPESVERLSATDNDAGKKAVDALKTSLNGRTVARTTWAPLPAALYSSDTNGEVTQQMDRGQSVLTNAFGPTDNEDWIVTDQADTNSLTSVKNYGFSRVIVPESALTTTSRATTLERPFNLSLGKKDSVVAGMADQGLSSHFSDSGSPILNAHQLLADLAVLWNDLPGQQRAVIVMPPRNWNPDAGFLETLFRGLDASTVLKAESTDDFFKTPTEKSGSTTLLRTLATLPKSDYSGFPTGRITDNRKRLDGFTDLVDSDNQTLLQYQQRILLAERSDLDARTRNSQLDDLHTNIQQQFNMIQLPSTRTIRLTAREGQIPISVQNNTGYEVHVVVELTSNKVLFPEGTTRTVDLSRQHVTEAFSVDARTTGAFPLQVRLLSPDGKTVIQRSSITVHSTATSALGVGLSVGAGLFLVIWWIRSAIKTRRKKRLAVL